MINLATELLNGLTADEAARFVDLGTRLNLTSGSILFKLGEPAEQMFLVLSGRINLTLPMQIKGGEEDVLIEEKMAGETMGWSGLIPPHRFTLKAVAAVETEVIAFPRAALLEHFSENPGVGYAIHRNVAGVIGHRLGIFQTMWLREMQRVVELRYS
jgi:CRP-like cAMP-binding protein